MREGSGTVNPVKQVSTPPGCWTRSSNTGPRNDRKQMIEVMAIENNNY
jgi:hypothetical protein